MLGTYSIKNKNPYEGQTSPKFKEAWKNYTRVAKSLRSYLDKWDAAVAILQKVCKHKFENMAGPKVCTVCFKLVRPRKKGKKNGIQKGRRKRTR